MAGCGGGRNLGFGFLGFYIYYCDQLLMMVVGWLLTTCSNILGRVRTFVRRFFFPSFRFRGLTRKDEEEEEEETGKRPERNRMGEKMGFCLYIYILNH